MGAGKKKRSRRDQAANGNGTNGRLEPLSGGALLPAAEKDGLAAAAAALASDDPRHGALTPLTSAPVLPPGGDAAADVYSDLPDVSNKPHLTPLRMSQPTFGANPPTMPAPQHHSASTSPDRAARNRLNPLPGGGGGGSMGPLPSPPEPHMPADVLDLPVVRHNSLSPLDSKSARPVPQFSPQADSMDLPQPDEKSRNKRKLPPTGKGHERRAKKFG